MTLASLRGRTPLVVVILLAVVCLGIVGFACACMSDQPTVALERAVQTPALAPSLAEVWPALLSGAFSAGLLLCVAVAGRGRASPAVLQRFLF